MWLLVRSGEDTTLKKLSTSNKGREGKGREGKGREEFGEDQRKVKKKRNTKQMKINKQEEATKINLKNKNVNDLLKKTGTCTRDL